jgi:pilus assembly protein Flp/PilA
MRTIMDKPARFASFPDNARRLAVDASGATAIEYALIASMVSIVIAVAVNAMGVTVQGMFQSVADLMH